jgi:hypothetical protein
MDRPYVVAYTVTPLPYDPVTSPIWTRHQIQAYSVAMLQNDKSVAIGKASQ